MFRRVQHRNMESQDASVHPENKLFGRALSDVCQKDGCPPKPIMVRNCLNDQ